ncbi:MAG TPA: S8 family peptidase [Cyclobacteriaceae bacterium]|nr:S8 family peptidase [Cyclobacteriaceae bacterium]
MINRVRKCLFFSIFWISITFPAFSQQLESGSISKDWFLKDPVADRVQGISAEKAYQTFLKNQPSRTIIVAVVDSGVDIDHEDLRNVIWTNEGEIPDNGIDDDNNGYIDDVHGWNFIGGKDGNVNQDTDEFTRAYVKLKKQFEGVDEKKISKKEKPAYEEYIKAKQKFEKLVAENTEQYELYNNLYQNVSLSVDTLKVLLMTDSLTQDLVQSFESSEPNLLFAKGFVLNIFRNIGTENSIEEFVSELKEAAEHFQQIVEYGYNEDFDPRSIVGDNYNDPYEKGYGNNDVKGPDAMHGTHVAGIIAADRKNDIGIKGIADNVRIMSVRTVPNGDERDKDVANAILYAVDNGAHIINMSFGKSTSPRKEVVDKAVKYAVQKGVLLIHAAGNESDDIDVEKNYPTRFYLDGSEAKNWLEVGASSWGADKDFVGSFSNYGKKSVDLFAPGVEIYSTVPDNKYKDLNGTSMASPVTAGVAAVIMSYFPEFTALEVKEIIRQSTRKFDNLKINMPGSKGEIEFSQMSSTGGLINLYEAVKLAQELKVKKLSK